MCVIGFVVLILCVYNLVFIYLLCLCSILFVCSTCDWFVCVFVLCVLLVWCSLYGDAAYCFLCVLLCCCCVVLFIKKYCLCLNKSAVVNVVCFLDCVWLCCVVLVYVRVCCIVCLCMVRTRIAVVSYCAPFWIMVLILLVLVLLLLFALCVFVVCV